MKELVSGLYDFLGNTVEYYEGDSTGYDLDSREEIPADALLALGELIEEF